MMQILKKVFPVSANTEYALWCDYVEVKEGGELVKGCTASDFLFVKVCALTFGFCVKQFRNAR